MTEEVFDYSISEEVAKISNSYMMVDTKFVPTNLTKVADIATGGQRNRRYGLVLSIAVVPELDKQEDPIMVSQQMPCIFVDADSLEDLGVRAKEEIDVIIRHTGDILSGRIVPPVAEDFDEQSEPSDSESDIRVHTS
jgi:hypothetical protein